MANDNEIVFKGDNTQLKAKLQENEAAFKSLEEAIESGAKTAKEVAKEQKALLDEQAKLKKELARVEKQEDREAAQARKKVDQEERKRRQDASREEKQLRREALQIMERSETAQERYNRKIADLKKHLAAGRIESRHFNIEAAKLNKELHDIGDHGVSSMMGIVSALTGVGGAIAALQAGIAAVRQEYEQLTALQEKSRDKNVEFQNSMQSLRMNFVPDESVTRDQLDERVQDLALRSKVPLGVAANALNGALSSKGNLDNQWAVDATDAAFQLTKDPTEAAALAKAAGDIAKFGESTDPMAILTYMMQSQKASRNESVSGLGRQAIPALGAGKEMGLSLERGMELYTGIGNIMGDTTGETSSTAMVTLMGDLRRFQLKDKQKKNKDLVDLHKQYTALPMDADTRIQFLQNHPQLRDAFNTNYPGQEKAGVAIRSLLNNDAKWQETISTVESQVPSLSKEADATNRKFFSIEAPSIQGKGTVAGEVADIAGQSAANLERQTLQRPVESFLATMRDIFQRTIANNDLKGWDSGVEWMLNRNMEIGEIVGSEQPEDVIYKTFKEARQYVRDEDLSTFDEQMGQMERAREGARNARIFQGSSPQKPVKLDPNDTMSRPGFEDVPPINERGAYEGGTAREVTSTSGPLGSLVAAMTSEIKGLRTDMARQARDSDQRSQKETSKMVVAIKETKPIPPQKPSPLSAHDRGNRQWT